MTLAEFLSWLSTPSGIAIAVGLLLSWLIDYLPRYGYLSPKEKRLVYLGLCLLIPLLAATLRGLAGYAAWSFDPLYWQALTAGATAFGAGTLVHTAKLPDVSERRLLNRYIAADLRALGKG